MDDIVEISDLTKNYPGDVTALDEVSLSVEDGEFLGIIGPTGCGKSTMLEIIAGLIEPTDGYAGYDGEEIRGPHPSIGIVFQEDSTFPWRTAIKNVEFGLEAQGVDKEERHEQAKEMIDLVGLNGFENKYPGELSGGMQQRVSIARTLVTDPRVLLMDEPFGALDEQTRIILGNELLDIWEETGSTILFVTHNINEAAVLADRIVVMTARPGRIKGIVDNPLPRPRSDDVMETEAFSDVTQEMWDLLKEEARTGMEAER